VPIDQKQTLINLVKMYCYEWSQYNGIDLDSNGEYAFERDIDRFFTKERHFPFFIKVDEKLAGFVLVDDDFDLDKNSDYAISEFFVMHKYRREGVGKQAAREIFIRFPGRWEIKMHPQNTISIKFWKSVVGELTNNNYSFIESCEQARYMDGSLGTIIQFVYGDLLA